MQNVNKNTFLINFQSLINVAKNDLISNFLCVIREMDLVWLNAK